MKLYFVFSASLTGPVADIGGGFDDLSEIVKSEEEARALAQELAGRDEHGYRSIAWFNSVDSETLEVSRAERFE